MTIKDGDSSAVSNGQRTAPADAPVSEKGRRAASPSSSPETDRLSVDTHQAVFAKLLDPTALAVSSRLTELQRLYASGQYSVDAGAVSRALIDSALIGD